MATTYKSKSEAQAVADVFNAKFLGAGYSVTFVSQHYAAAMKLPRGGHYLVNPWGKIV